MFSERRITLIDQFLFFKNNKKLFKPPFIKLKIENKQIIQNKDIEQLHKELDEVKDRFLREIQGFKTTLNILQDKEAMETIEESERLFKEGVESEEFVY